jgi:hypothetical protein
MIWIIWATVFITFFLATYGIVMAWNRRQRVKLGVLEEGSVSGSPLLRPKEQPSTLRNCGYTVDLLGAMGFARSGEGF